MLIESPQKRLPIPIFYLDSPLSVGYSDKEKEGHMNYISLTEAAARCDYSQEYLSLRARQGKLKAVKQGRNWVTTHAWLMDYLRQADQSRRELQTVIPATHSQAGYTEKTTAVAPAVVKISDEASRSTAVAPMDRLDRADKVREDVRFQPVVPRSWLDDSEEDQRPVALLNNDSFWSNDTTVDTSVQIQKSTIVEPVAEPEVMAVDQAGQPAMALPAQDYKTTPWHGVAGSSEPQEESQTEPQTDTISVAEEDQPAQSSLSFAWLRPAVFAIFALALIIEIGVLARPIMASTDAPRKMAVGLAVITGQATPVSLVSDTSDTTGSTAGSVAGVATHRHAAQVNNPTVLQKIATGLKVVLDDPYDGSVTPAGEWLTETFHLPVE
jgi:hypothetical protein